MVSPDLVHTEVAILSGKADLEVDYLYKKTTSASMKALPRPKSSKPASTASRASPSQLQVFDGKAAVSPVQNAKWITVHGGHELALNAEPGKPHDFNKDAAEDDLYKWERSARDYLGQANASLLEAEYAGAPGIYPGWAWDSAFYGYTWLPYDGIPLQSRSASASTPPAFLYGGGFGYYGGFRGGMAASAAATVPSAAQPSAEASTAAAVTAKACPERPVPGRMIPPGTAFLTTLKKPPRSGTPEHLCAPAIPPNRECK